MSMISEQIEELRLMAEMFVNGEPYGNLLRRAADTIEMLSEKVREPSNSEKPNNSTSSKMEQVDEPKTQMKTQNSNLTFEKDECAKEYEELGLKELKELIKADRKTENISEIPNNCEYAKNPSGDVWECGCFLDTYCEHQIYDRNPDGTINIVECGYEPKDEPTISKMEQVDKDINVRSKDEPQVVMPKKCKGCDSASKIIEAYSRGFEDGAEAVKAVQTDCSWK